MQRFSSLVLPSPSQPIGVFSEATSSPASTSLLQAVPIGEASKSSSSSAGLLQPPLEDTLDDDSFTDVSISEGDHNSNSSGSTTPNFAGSGLVPTTSGGDGSSEVAASPGGLLSKILHPSFSSITSRGGEEPTTPIGGSGESSSSIVRAVADHRPSKRSSAYPRSPDRSRKASRAMKKSKSPRSGRGSARASPRNSPRNVSSRASRAAATKRASSNVVEEDLTGGISNLLASRRLSSLNDKSAFSDNRSVVDH